jgi:hypothetical protein
MSRVKLEDKIEVCYLCGEALGDDYNQINKDHVPMRQLYSPEIRNKYCPQLLTLPTHKTCNSSYQLDEDYFINSIVIPFSPDSYAGRSLYIDKMNKFRSGKQIKLANRVLKEFDHKPSGLVLPYGKVAKRFDNSRVKRVIWKLIRGLYFHEHRFVLPSSNQNKILEICIRPNKPSDEFLNVLKSEPFRGNYPGVFDYRFKRVPESNYEHWEMCFLDRVIINFVFISD